MMKNITPIKLETLPPSYHAPASFVFIHSGKRMIENHPGDIHEDPY